MENPINELIAWSKSLKILYVEDDVILRQEVRLFLSDIFEEVDEACNGQEGLDKLASHHYDLVISDIRMPVMDGIEMIEQIKKRYPKQPILVTSAHNEIEYLIKLINLGVENFITKPLQSEQILRVLHAIVERIQRDKELEEYKKNLELANERLSKLASTQSLSLDLKNSVLKAYQEAIEKAAIVTITNKDGIITYVNENYCKATGYSFDEVVGQRYDIITHLSNSPGLYDEIWESLLAKKTWQGLIVSQTRALMPLYHYKTIVPIINTKGEIIEFISVIQDLTELYKRNEASEKENLTLALDVKEDELLKQIPFASALMHNDLSFHNYNKHFEELVNNHTDESLLLKLTQQLLSLKELVAFEEMDQFESVDAIKSNWPYEGDITFRATVCAIGASLNVLVKISRYQEDDYLVCIVKEEDFESCCQVQEK